jgi:hypothetical protein
VRAAQGSLNLKPVWGRLQVLLAPSLYDPPLWAAFLPPATLARKVVLLRHPIDVLEAAFHQTLVRRCGCTS